MKESNVAFYTDTLADYVLSESYESLPSEVIAKAKELILDTIGCAFGGYVTKADDPLIRYISQLGGKAECTIVGDGTKVPCGHAAGVNAQMANILDFDETYRNRAHPASSIIFSAIAAAEQQQASGKDIITAAVTGYEIATRVGDATHPSPELIRKVWIQNWYVFGCAAAAAKLLHLSKEQIKNSFAIAGAAAPTLNVHRILDMPGAMFKLPNFWFARLGIEAAELARDGITGFHDYLDGERGYWVTVSDLCRWELMTENLGKEYNLVKYMTLKPWSTCRWVHPGIELLLQIVKDQQIRLDDIEEILFKAHWKVCGPPYNNPEPKTIWDAFWSVPYSIAIALSGVKPGPAWFAEESLRNPRVLSLANKIRIEADDEATRMFEEKPEASVAKVELRTRNEVFSSKTMVARGDPDRPMSKQEIEAKFLDMATKVLSEQSAKELASAVWRLEELGNAQELVSQLSCRYS